MRVRALAADENGQAAVEWTGLVALVALAFAGLVALTGLRPPGTALAAAVLGRIECAVGFGDACADPPDLVAAYGPDVAAAVARAAPRIVYEDGMTAVPVDFRECRTAACGNGAPWGAITRSNTGDPVAAFVHVVDCRDGGAATAEPLRFDCSGERAGHLYIQYWLYWDDSATLRGLPGPVGYHADDWEELEVRIGPNATEARASSHNGYDYDGGAGNWPSDAGITNPAHWGPASGRILVSGGSHAGHVRQYSGAPSGDRFTPAGGLELIPIETLGPSVRHTRFAIPPPWRKPTWRDPEA